MKSSTRFALMSASILLAMVTGFSAKAATYFFDDPGVATATITTGLGTLNVVITNLVANPTSAAQEISGIQINVGNTPSSVSLSSSSGTLIDINTKTHMVFSDPGSIDHWGVAKSGATIYLATAGTGSPGGQPRDLIIGPGPYTNANTSVTNFEPLIQNTATFVLLVGGITDSTLINTVNFEFGTGPDSFSGPLLDPPAPGATPLPAAFPLFAGGAGLLGFLGWRRKKHVAQLAS